MNHKTIKLFGGPGDGSIIEVLHSLTSYTVQQNYPDGETISTVYEETTRRSSNGEVIFSCYDNLSELR